MRFFRCLQGFRPLSRPSDSLLLAQERVTREKGTPGAAPCAHPCATGPRPVTEFFGGTSVCRRKTMRILRIALRVLSTAARRCAWGPLQSGASCAKSAKPSQADRRKVPRCGLRSFSCAHDARALMGPHAVRRRAADKGRRLADRDVGHRFAAQDVLSERPADRSGPVGQDVRRALRIGVSGSFREAPLRVRERQHRMCWPADA